MIANAQDLPEKPLLRGASHQAAFFAALGAGAFLIYAAAEKDRALVALVYVASLVTMYGVSALYHRLPWRPAARALMRRLDHSAIFLLIAGTYTPFCLLGMEPSSGIPLLTVVWGGALLGIAMNVLFPSMPRWLRASPYVLLGWVAVMSAPFVTPTMSLDVMVLLIAGGVAYTIGALVYATRRPNPSPLYFGFHEIFHVFVIVASVLHFVAVARLVLA